MMSKGPFSPVLLHVPGGLFQQVRTTEGYFLGFEWYLTHSYFETQVATWG